MLLTFSDSLVEPQNLTRSQKSWLLSTDFAVKEFLMEQIPENLANASWEVKAWGMVRHLFRSDQAAVSYLCVNRGTCCSRHLHQHRANQFVILSGKIVVEEWLPEQNPVTEQPKQRVLLTPGSIHVVSSLVPHRFRVAESGQVIEVYWPDRGGKVEFSDITRFDVGGPDIQICDIASLDGLKHLS